MTTAIITVCREIKWWIDRHDMEFAILVAVVFSSVLAVFLLVGLSEEHEQDVKKIEAGCIPMAYTDSGYVTLWNKECPIK